MKKLFSTLVLLLATTSALAGPPILWNGADAKLINSGSLLVPGGGTASTPGITVSGAPYAAGTATTSKPQLLIEPTGTTSTNWTTTGTMFGLNAPSGFAGLLADLQLNNARKFSFDGGSTSKFSVWSGSEAASLTNDGSTICLDNTSHANSCYLRFRINTGYFALGVAGTNNNNWYGAINGSATNTNPLTGIVPNANNAPGLILHNTDTTAGNYGYLGGSSGSSDKMTSAFAFFTDVHTAASETGHIEAIVRNAGTAATAMKINSDKTVTLSGYGAGRLSANSSGVVTSGDVESNRATNGGFEGTTPTTGWTASGGATTTTTATAANVGSGANAYDWNSNAASQTLTNTSVTVTSGDGLSGQNGVVSCRFKAASGTATHTLQAYDGTNVLASTTITSSTSGFVRASVNFQFPVSGTTALRIVSAAADEPEIFIDDCYIGLSEGFNTYQVSQATLVGTVKVTGCAAQWSTTSTSFAAMAAQTGCTYTVTGSAQAPSTNIAGVKFASLAPGEYKLEVEGAFEQATGNKEAVFQFTDGTNTAREESRFLTTSGGDSWVPGINQSIGYSSAQSNVTLQIYAKTSSGGTAQVLGTTASPMVIRVYRFPTSAESAYRPDIGPSSWSGYSTGTWTTSTTGGSFADPLTSAHAIVELKNRNFGTVTATSNLPKITWTPTRAMRYFVCNSGRYYYNAAAADMYGQLWDYTNSVSIAEVYTRNGSDASVTASTSQTMCGIVEASSTSPITIGVRVHGSNSGGTYGQASRGMDWTIIAIDQAVTAPVLVGSVTSASTGQQRIESARVTNNGTTCSVSSSSSSWLTPARNGTGDCEATITTGIFSAAPTCVVTAETANASLNNTQTKMSTTGGGPTATYIRWTTGNTGGTLTDLNVNLICMGPR